MSEEESLQQMCSANSHIWGWNLGTYSKIGEEKSAAQHNMERNMLGITYKDRETNRWVRDQTKTLKTSYKQLKQGNGN